MKTSGPREFITPHRTLPLEIPEGAAPPDFFNSPCNLRHLARDNGLLRNPLGNAITELLFIVVKRVADEEAYARAEPHLIRQLPELRGRLVRANLGTPITSAKWSVKP